MMICGLSPSFFFRGESFVIFFLFDIFINLLSFFLFDKFIMLFYNLITDNEGRDNSEGNDAYFNKELLSKQCITCRFFYYISKNYKNKNNICDGCFHCVKYENENHPLTFRIITLEIGTFRTVSDYFLKEIEEILQEKNFNSNETFGWIYKELNNN